MYFRGGSFFRNIFFVSGIVLLFLLILASFPAISHSSKQLVADFFHPYFSVSGTVKDNIADTSLLLRSKTDLSNEITSLRNELSLAQIQNQQQETLRMENRQMRQLLSLSEIHNFKYLPCEVQLFDPLYYQESFTLNRGSTDGVTPNLAVIAVINSAGKNIAVVAGFVREVSKHTSVVSTLLNRSLRLPVMLESAGVTGFVNGENAAEAEDSLANLSFLPLGGNYRVGERVFTTNFNAEIPPGLLLGTLEKMDEKNAIFNSALFRRGHLRAAFSGPDQAKFMMVAIPETENRLAQ